MGISSFQTTWWQRLPDQMGFSSTNQVPSNLINRSSTLTPSSFLTSRFGEYSKSNLTVSIFSLPFPGESDYINSVLGKWDSMMRFLICGGHRLKYLLHFWIRCAPRKFNGL